MPFRQVFAPRSVPEWSVRGLIAILIAMVGYVSGVHALANTVRGRNIEWAHTIVPTDGQIMALLSQQLSGGEATANDRRRADQLAREALTQDATAVAAVATLGIDAQVRGDTADARRLLSYANALSRRDLRTQVWAIEDAVSRGDVPSALQHYDIALRTGRSASNLLFPILGSAIGDPTIRAALTNTIAGGPEWASHFINYAAGEAPDPRAVSQLFTTLRYARVSVSGNAYTLLINRLIAENLLADAWSVYASTHPGVDRRVSRDPNFENAEAIESRFNWSLINESGVSTSIQRGANGNLFEFSAPSSVGGVLLQQTQVLPEGTYQLSGRSEGVDQLEGARPYWVLTCVDGRELGRVEISNSAHMSGVFKGQFKVPAGCPLQMLSLFANPSDVATGLSGRILKARIDPVL